MPLELKVRSGRRLDRRDEVVAQFEDLMHVQNAISGAGRGPRTCSRSSKLTRRSARQFLSLPPSLPPPSRLTCRTIYLSSLPHRPRRGHQPRRTSTSLDPDLGFDLSLSLSLSKAKRKQHREQKLLPIPGHRIDDNEGIASTRTRGYRLRIAENLNHSSWLIPCTQMGGVDRNKCCHRPEVLRERPRS